MGVGMAKQVVQLMESRGSAIGERLDDIAPVPNNGGSTGIRVCRHNASENVILFGRFDELGGDMDPILRASQDSSRGVGEQLGKSLDIHD